MIERSPPVSRSRADPHPERRGEPRARPVMWPGRSAFGPPDPDGRVGRGVVAVVWLAGLAALTLTPNGGPVARIVSFCLLCGDRGVADALLNVVLFVPLGLLIGRGRGAVAALTAGVAVSFAVEVGQLLLRGRYSNMGDLVWNGLGAWLGAICLPWLRSWLPDRSSLPARAVAVGLPTTWILVGGILLLPAPIDSGFTFDDGASLHPSPVAEDDHGELVPVRSDDASTHDLEDASMDRSPNGEWRLRAATVRRPLMRRLIPIVVVYDAEKSPILVLGADRGDLVLWQRTWAEAVGLDHANQRLWSGLSEHRVGRTLTLGASNTIERGLCLAVEDREVCGMGTSPARTWTILRSREHAPERFKLMVDIAWMATLTFSVGLLGGSVRGTLVSAGVFGLLVLVLPHLTPLVAAGWPELVGIAVGVGAGVAFRPLARLIV